MASLIGTNANQLSTNGMLGEMAFQDSSGITVGSVQSPVGLATTTTINNFPISGSLNDYTNLTLQPNVGNVIVGSGISLGTTATNGFLCIPSCFGTPTGNPVGVPLGAVPLIYDTANNRLYTRTPDGTWRYSSPDENSITGINVIDDNTNSIRYISFQDVSSGVSTNTFISSTKLVFNPSTGSLGIGTTNPRSALQVGAGATINFNGGATFSGILTASSVNASGIVSSNTGFNLGISSAGVAITTGPVKTLNFIGAGNTFAIDGSTVNISILGGGGESHWVKTTSGIHTLSSVGIGTTNPSQSFQVGAGSSVVVIDNLGELGIRTTNPIHPLHINSRTDLVPVLVAVGATIGITTTIITGISTAGITTGLEIIAINNIIDNGTTVSGIGSTSITINPASLNNTQQNNVTLTFAARNDGNVVVVTGIGSVGIGTTNPTSKLQVNGDIILDDGGTFSTTLQMVTPTAERVISFPNATGTVGLVAGTNLQLTYNNLGEYAGVGDGTVIVSGPRFTLGFGYGVGAGGSVTQATNKSTGVTLNTLCGTITMNNAALAANTTATFVLTNSNIAATDLIVLNHSSVGTFGSYTLNGRAATGSASIDVRNVSAGSLSEAIVLRFAVINATIT